VIAAGPRCQRAQLKPPPLPTVSLQPLHLHIYWAVTVASQVKHRVRSTCPRSAVAASGHRATIGRKASGWLIALARRAAAEAAAITRNVAGWCALAEAEYERARGAAQPESWWWEAATAWEQLQRPPLAASCRWRQAEALVAAGASRAEASGPLRQAYAVAARIGATPLAGAARAARPARGWSSRRRTLGRPTERRAWGSSSA